MSDVLQSLAQARASGRPRGIASICSAHPTVIRASARRAARDGSELLIEATCNQVNQFGGYTGMKPEDFVRFVSEIARSEGLDPARIIFGGDHLGPNPWRKDEAEAALANAESMVEAYVAAGFRKIHLDASMGCAGEPAALDDETTARRAARLAAAAERTAARLGIPAPLYVIGTEVPVPGGADHALDDVPPTAPEAARETLAVHRAIFREAGQEAALDRVIALVVQPGVEFGNENVVPYQSARAQSLSKLLDEEAALVFEAHSTDYQSRDALRALVEDGFPILKVGPGLTFALREALYGLDLVASELVEGYGDRPLKQATEALMLAKPGHWQGHYGADPHTQRIQRHYSYSDRIRYYWNELEAKAAVDALLAALKGRAIPPTLMSQFLPALPVGAGSDPEEILIAAVDRVLADYAWACRPAE